VTQPVEERSLGPLLTEICRLNHMRMHTLLHDLGLYCGQPWVLGALWRKEGLTHSELSTMLHRTPATITNMIRRMEKSGFVTRRSDPEDQRVSRVYLTDAGRAIQDRVRETWQELEARQFANFTLEERVLMRRLLIQVRDNLMSGVEA